MSAAERAGFVCPRMVRRTVLLLVILIGCTKRNPDVCCETEQECAAIGTSEFVVCGVGVCIDHRCIDEGTCDGDEDCSAGTCTNSTCTVPVDAAVDGPPVMCPREPNAQCRQILAHYCAAASRCNPDPMTATQCAQDIDGICNTSTAVLSEIGCQYCRASYDQLVCGATSQDAENCSSCYGLSSMGQAVCPM